MTHELIGLEVVEEKGKGTMGGLGSVGGRVISGACSQRIEAVRHLMWAYQFATSPPRLAGNPRSVFKIAVTLASSRQLMII